MENTLLYSATVDEQKTYILGALDSSIGSYSLSRPQEWEAYVHHVFDAANPSEVITPFSMQECYNQYNGERIPSAGLNAYTLSSSSTASIVLRKAMNNSNYSVEQENRPYTFKGIMTRPFYYNYCFASVIEKLGTCTIISRFINPDRTDEKSILIKYFGEAIFESMLSNKARQVLVILKSIFKSPTTASVVANSAITTPFYFLTQLVDTITLLILVSKLGKWLPAILPARATIFVTLYGGITQLFQCVQFYQHIGAKIMEIFSAIISMYKNLKNRTTPIVNETLSVSSRFFDNAAYMFSESFYGRDFIVAATARYLFSPNSQTINTRSLFSLFQVPQFFLEKICRLLGYSTIFRRLVEGPADFEVSAHKLAIVPASILAGKDGVLECAASQNIAIKPCLLLSVLADGNQPARKEIREFDTIADLQDYLIGVPNLPVLRG